MRTKHPPGLYILFFTEMWERFGFYIIGGILLLYALDFEKGGLSLTSKHANEIVGTYLAFVYFTPFLGGLIADRYLGYRRSVLIGGLIMSAGHFLLGTPGEFTFTAGLVCVCIGNGFFKPNISVMVGNLYQPGDPRRDAGFNIFYMGINVGAFLAFFSAGIIRNEAGWSWAFRAAGFGLLLGVLILLVNWRKLAVADRQPERSPDDVGIGRIFGTILAPALGVGIAGYLIAKNFFPGSPVSPQMTAFIAGMIPVIVFFVRIGLKAKPDEKPGLLALIPVFVAGGTFFMILHLNTTALTQWANSDTDRHSANVFDAVDVIPYVDVSDDAMPSYFRNALPEAPRPDPRTLVVTDAKTAKMFGTQRMDEPAVAEVERVHGDLVTAVVAGALGSRRQDAPAEAKKRAVSIYPPGTVQVVETVDHGRPSISVKIPDGVKPAARVVFLRKIDERLVPVLLVDQPTFDDVYARAGSERLPPGTYLQVTNTEYFQSANSFWVIAFTPLVVWFFNRMRARGRAISTAHKILYGLLLTMASMLFMAIAGWLTDGNTMKVSAWWLFWAYGIMTLGELCLSPMGLSLVTKLSPKRLVGLMMGGWFCATAFGNKLSGFFGGIQGLMSPTAFFLVLAACVGLVALFIAILLPRLDAAIKRYGA